ncbi:hypothetical protein ACGFZK_31160 [Streptomyces sp. NPDC048257]|uniref:hypothetical protein n=1 Tax=Streptomyces sp. NPDC048257 TaxID=3365526 RepID=UPI0037117947
MSRPRHVWSLLGVVLAVLLGCAAPAAAVGSVRTAPAPIPIPASAPVLISDAAPARAQPHAAAFTEGEGPACAPRAPERGGTPAVPPRAAGEHAQVPPARPVPDEAGPPAAMPVRSPVRGPGRPAPDRLELCVMRV